MSCVILDRESFHEMIFERIVKEGGLEVRAIWALLLAAGPFYKLEAVFYARGCGILLEQGSWARLVSLGVT